MFLVPDLPLNTKHPIRISNLSWSLGYFVLMCARIARRREYKTEHYCKACYDEM